MEDKHGRQALLVGRLNKKTNFIDWIFVFWIWRRRVKI